MDLEYTVVDIVLEDF